ncbi:uncharacterized protein LOC117323083 [Pecten maximus]|uniref:uncharacterized protein LOC117323083 n=1 Tax=Pecten maximus TaxID=6579 RepID=UPI0014582209|nr:uncharacterized protein LOC117323083 [Pecten maximus]XP_033733982.1 uncharacterized protein LOC117323083 [Pecten maximus]XP_033733983.1 uncharacterized protein LOC117323083 [Pecten maximus]
MEKDRIVSTEKGPTKSSTFLSKITVIARLWAILTLAVMWGAGVYTIQNPPDVDPKLYLGWYLIAASIVVTLLELTWIINKSTCCKREGCCCHCWSVIMWIDNWKKGVLYLLLSAPVFMEGLRNILGIISGFLLVVCGLLYIVKTFKDGIVYTVTETRYVKTYTPNVNMLVHEMATQTDDDRYYEEISPNRRR